MKTIWNILGYIIAFSIIFIITCTTIDRTTENGNKYKETYIYMFEKHGVKDMNGNRIIPTKYNKVFPIEADSRIVAYAGQDKHGILELYSTDGRLIADNSHQFDNVRVFHSIDADKTLLRVESSWKNGLIDIDGRTILPCTFDYITKYKLDGFGYINIAATTKDSTFVFDFDGNCIISALGGREDDEELKIMKFAEYDNGNDIYYFNIKGNIYDSDGKEVFSCTDSTKYIYMTDYGVTIYKRFNTKMAMEDVVFFDGTKLSDEVDEEIDYIAVIPLIKDRYYFFEVHIKNAGCKLFTLNGEHIFTCDDDNYLFEFEGDLDDVCFFSDDKYQYLVLDYFEKTHNWGNYNFLLNDKTLNAFIYTKDTKQPKGRKTELYRKRSEYENYVAESVNVSNENQNHSKVKDYDNSSIAYGYNPYDFYNSATYGFIPFIPNYSIPYDAIIQSAANMAISQMSSTGINDATSSTSGSTYGQSGRQPSNDSSQRTLAYYQENYSRWERQAASIYNSISNITVRNSDGSITGYSNVDNYGVNNLATMKYNYSEAQKEMRNIRMEAQREGITIPVSSWETTSIHAY